MCHLGPHPLLTCDRFRATYLGTGLGHSHVRFSLVGLQARPDVFSDVNIRNIDRDNLKGIEVDATTPRWCWLSRFTPNIKGKRFLE